LNQNVSDKVAVIGSNVDPNKKEVAAVAGVKMKDLEARPKRRVVGRREIGEDL